MTPYVATSPPSATATDPDAVDEALMQAMTDLRHKFRCNSVGGCPAHAVLVGFGPHALRPLVAMFPTAPARAPYRARIVRIVAELQLQEARPFLRERLLEGSDKTRGYAVYGLALLDQPEDSELLRRYAHAPGIIASAMTRLAAAWGLAVRGDAAGERRFFALMREAAAHQLGGGTLRWGLELCERPRSPDCESVFLLAAGHPSYVVRREVLRLASASSPTRMARSALRRLTLDPNPNLARRAKRALESLSPSKQPGLEPQL